MEFLPLVCAIVAGNFFTVMFCYGLWRASKIRADGPADLGTVGAIVFPVCLVLLGFWLYA